MINFGLIGCGSISNVHIEAVLAISEANLVAVCDIDSVKGEALARKHEVLFYQHYQELLNLQEIDAVIIATPHYLHKQMTVDALAANKHVLCEKPMAITVAEAKEVEHTVEKSGKVYATCYQNRFNPSFIKLRELLHEDKFGYLKGIKCDITWHRTSEYYKEADWKGSWRGEGGGVLINQAIHSLDGITWLIKRPTKIKGKIMTTLLDEFIEVEDTAMAVALIDERIPVVIHASNNYSSDPTPVITFDFEKGQVCLTNKELLFNNEVIQLEGESISSVSKDYWGNGHQRLLQTFVNKITKTHDKYEEYLASEDAIDSLMMVCGIYESNQTNQWVSLE